MERGAHAETNKKLSDRRPTGSVERTRHSRTDARRRAETLGGGSLDRFCSAIDFSSPEFPPRSVHLANHLCCVAHCSDADDVCAIRAPDKLNGHSDVRSAPDSMRLSGGCSSRIAGHSWCAKRLLHQSVNACKGNARNRSLKTIPVSLHRPPCLQLRKHDIGFRMAAMLRNLGDDKPTEVVRLRTSGYDCTRKGEGE